MKALPLCVALLAVLCAPTAAQVRYDLKLERAVMEIIARKIGDIRPSLSLEPPSRRAKAGAASRLPSRRAAVSVAVIDPVPLPREVRDNWRVLRGADDTASVSAGSFQSFSDTATIPPSYPESVEAKTVSRVIDF